MKQKEILRIEMTAAEAERLGLAPYRYRLKYVINGSRFKRIYRTRVAAESRADVLATNGIVCVLKRVPLDQVHAS